MNHIGDTNKMAETPRTDAVQDELINQDTYTSWLEMSQTARQLERELNAANQRIERLEEAGVELRECASWVGHSCCQYADQILRAKAAIEAWDKEAKP